MMRQRRRAKARRRSRAETAAGCANSFFGNLRPGETGEINPVCVAAVVGELARDVLFFVFAATVEGE